MARVLLVRHGESAWNAEGRWQGQADPPLTQLGRRQAAVAARGLGRVDAVMASDLQRAVVTAEVIAEALGLGPVLVDAGWRERAVGEWSGLTREQIHQRWPGYLPDDPARARPRLGDDATPERRPPGWESDDALLERTVAALSRLLDRAGNGDGDGDGDVLVITHGGVIYNLEHHLGDDAGRIPNLGGRWVQATAEQPGQGPMLRLGERMLLLEPEAVTLTVPGEL